MVKFFLKVMGITCAMMLGLTLAGQTGGRWIPVHALSFFREHVGIGLIDVNRHLSGWLVADPTVESAGQWSPDGSRLAYVARSVQNDTDIFLLDMNTWTIQNISQSNADDMLPLWSPDGNLLAYATQDVYNGGLLQRRLWIRVVGMRGEESPEHLTQSEGLNIPQAWSPDGRMLAFIHVADTATTQIHVVDTATGEIIPRFTQTQGNYFSPSWSPDGRWFAFAKMETENTIIYIVSSETGRVRRLSAATASLPIWSPDSQYLVYTALATAVGGAREVMYLAEAETGQIELLTQHDGSDSQPIWSPDGRWLVFESDRDGRFKLYMTDMDSRETRLITPESYFPNPDMVWSPDGRWLAFTSPVTQHVDVYVMDMVDYSITRLTTGGGNFVGHWQP